MGRKAHQRGSAKKGKEKESSVWDESPEPYPHFELDLNPEKYAASHEKLMDDILALILERVEDEMKRLPHSKRKPTTLKGKPYTPLSGAFLVDLFSSADGDAEMKPVTLLYGLMDLYLQGFNVARVWYMLQDAYVRIPPSTQISYGQVGHMKKSEDPFKNGTVTLSWTGNYNHLGEGKYQKFHYRACQKAYKKLHQAGESFQNKKSSVLANAMGFFAVTISECVRYKEISKWVVLHSTDPLIFIGVMLPPDKITDIGEWGTNSDKCYEDDPPERLRVIKRNLVKHSLLHCETVYNKEKGKGKGVVKEVAAEAEVEKLDKEETEDEQSTFEEEVDKENEEENGNEEDGALNEEGQYSLSLSHLTFSCCFNFSEIDKKNEEENGDEEDVALDEEDVDKKNEENDDEDDDVFNEEDVDEKNDEENDEEDDAILGDKEFVEIISVAFSADGHLAAFISDDGKVTIRETHTGTLLGILQGDVKVKWVNWTSDGSFILGVSASHEAYVWSIEHSAVIGKLPGKVTCGDFSASGDYLCTGSGDGLLRIWSPSLVCQRVVAVGSEVTCLVITADSEFVISGSEDGSILVVDIDSGLAIGSLVGNKGSASVTCIGMSPSSSNIMASGSSDGKVVIWDVVAQKATCVCFHQAGVRSLAWVGQTRYVASACDDWRVRVWDSVTGSVAATSTEFEGISKLMMSPCGKELLVFASGPAGVLDVSMFE